MFNFLNFYSFSSLNLKIRLKFSTSPHYIIFQHFRLLILDTMILFLGFLAFFEYPLVSIDFFLQNSMHNAASSFNVYSFFLRTIRGTWIKT